MDLRKVLEEQILDEISREGLLAARIRQLERRSKDVERATATRKEARTNNKAWWIKRISATPTEEGDMVLVFIISTRQRRNLQYDGSGIGCDHYK